MLTLFNYIFKRQTLFNELTASIVYEGCYFTTLTSHDTQ